MKNREGKVGGATATNLSGPYLMALRHHLTVREAFRSKLDVISWQPAEEVPVPISRTAPPRGITPAPD